MKKTAKKKVAKKAAKKVVKGFVFTGDPIGGDDPPFCNMHGYLFPLNGQAVAVSDEVAALLKTHSHFTEK